jgi:uncharacterized protein YidB (DUF937 family)
MGLMDSLNELAGGLPGGQGGLDGILSQLQAGGLGEQVQSWIGKGGNLPISAEQLESVLGSGPLGDLAQKFGIDPHQAAGQLSALLPQVIDQLTPDGKLPEGGLGSGLGNGLGGALGGMAGDLLGGFLKR